MAEKSSFFTSLNGDRRYKATDFAEYFSTFIGNGVFPNPSTNLQVISNTDMTITVNKGYAWINGYMYANTDNLILTVENADSTLKRIDRVVLKCDYVQREIKAYIKKGIFDSSPTAPNLQRDVDAYELCIAEIVIDNGVISISQSNITDTRIDSSLCGIVTQTVKTIDTTTLYNQLEAWKLEEIQSLNTWRSSQENIHNQWYSTTTNQLTVDFQTWFDTIKGVLDGDIAGNLTNRILELENKINNMKLEDTAITVQDVNNYFENDKLDKVLDELYLKEESNKTSIQSLQDELGINKVTLEANINAIRMVL